MKRILFQGDSITDCGRDREDDRFMGRGYATNVVQSLGFDYPGEYEFANYLNTISECQLDITLENEYNKVVTKACDYASGTNMMFEDMHTFSILF